MALPTKFPEVPTRLMDLQYQNCSTPPPPPNSHIQLLLRVGGRATLHTSAAISRLCSAGMKNERLPSRIRARLLLCLPEDGPERAVSEQVTTRDEGRTNMRPTATVCSIAPSRHCRAREGSQQRTSCGPRARIFKDHCAVTVRFSLGSSFRYGAGRLCPLTGLGELGWQFGFLLWFVPRLIPSA